MPKCVLLCALIALLASADMAMARGTAVATTPVRHASTGGFHRAAGSHRVARTRAPAKRGANAQPITSGIALGR